MDADVYGMDVHVDVNLLVVRGTFRKTLGHIICNHVKLLQICTSHCTMFHTLIISVFIDLALCCIVLYCILLFYFIIFSYYYCMYVLIR